MRRLACEELEARRLLAPIVTGVDPGGYEDDPAGFAAVQNVATQSLPVLSIADVTMAEGNSGTKTFTFTVSMSGSNPSGASVDYQTINWSATTADNDYVAASGALTWSPGDTSPKTIDVTVNGDTTSEPDETFYVVLDMADGADLLDGLGQGTISNDDFVPTLSMNNAWILEGDSGTQTLTLTVNVSGTNPSGASVNYRTADETATTADNDYVAASGKLTWAPGDTSSRTISVTVNGDTTFEGSDSFLVELFGGSGVILPLFPARGTIENDDDAFFSIDDVSVSEGDSGTKTFTFTVSFSGGIYARFANIDYATADGAATTAGNDYVAASGKLTWVAGDPSPKLVSVTVNGDTTYEPDETFYVNLSRPRGGVISDGQGTGLIRNDDASPLPALSIDDAGITEGDSGTKTLTFTVSMSGSNPSGASVNFATADGAATTAGNDYLAAAGSLTWAAGDTAAKSISVTVNGDTAFEPNETFYVDLSGPAGANISDSQGLGTIQNDDAQPLGTVDFLVLDSLDLSGGEVWLGLTTAHGGWLTLLTQTPGAQIALYDSSLVHRADSAAVDGNQRLDEAVSAAESFYVQLRGAGPAAELRIANLLQRDGTSVTVFGTSGPDQFAFDASAGRKPTIKGIDYHFTPAEATSFSFDGLAGSDDVRFLGSSGADDATIYPTSGTFTGEGYALSVSNIEATDYDGGDGEDTLWVWGSGSGNTYTARPGSAEMTGGGVSITAKAERIYGRGGGGADTATIWDSPGNDVFDFFPVWARAVGDGYFHNLQGFTTMIGKAERGVNGTDEVYFRDSPQGDWLKSTTVTARMLTLGAWRHAEGFDTITAYSRGGKDKPDVLLLQDTPGADTLKLKPLETTLTTPDYKVIAFGFGSVEATRVNLNTADDKVTLDDSTGDDTFVGNPASIQISSANPAYTNKAAGFPSVMAYSAGEGLDKAFFSDFTGAADVTLRDDTFTAGSVVSELAGAGYRLWARFFDEVYAEAKLGRDIANLNGSLGIEELQGTATEVSLSGLNAKGTFANYAKHFDEIHASAGTGQDKAIVTDASIEADYQPPDGVDLNTLSECLWLEGFEKVEHRTTGGGTTEINNIDQVFAYWE